MQGAPDRGTVPPAAAFDPMTISHAALILPACREEETIGPVLDELARVLSLPTAAGNGVRWTVAIGVNGSPVGTDRTADLARAHPLRPLVAETAARGYGHGCRAAIDLLESHGSPLPDAYVFFAADGANDPRDLAALVAARQGTGAEFVLGVRTRPPTLHGNLAAMGWSHVAANRLLGAWCGVLTGRPFADLGPLRLIGRELFHRLDLREWTFGWTIEAQVRAARLGVSVVTVPVRERPRLAGEQKISKVNLWRTLRIGAAIAAAGWRTARGGERVTVPGETRIGGSEILAPDPRAIPQPCETP